MSSGKDGLAYAGFGTRFVAFIIDWIILLVVLTVYWVFSSVIRIPSSISGLVWFLVPLAYFAYLEGGPKGATFGKRFQGLKVVKVDGTTPIGFDVGVMRSIGLIISGWLLCLGYILILFDEKKQGLADKLAGTVVVRVNSVNDAPVKFGSS